MLGLKDCIVLGVTTTSSVGHCVLGQTLGAPVSSIVANVTTCILTGLCGVLLLRVSIKTDAIESKMAFVDRDLHVMADHLDIELPRRD